MRDGRRGQEAYDDAKAAEAERNKLRDDLAGSDTMSFTLQNQNR